MASTPQPEPLLIPTCITLPRDQIDWLDRHAASRRISRSALVRQAVDALMRQQQRRAANGL